MLKSIGIRDFRGIKEGKLEGFQRLNIIVGPNNSGKSTILDAIMLGANPEPSRAFGDLLRRRPVLEVGNWLVRRSTVNGEPKLAHLTVQVGGRSRVTRIVRGVQSLMSDGSPLELEFWHQAAPSDDASQKMSKIGPNDLLTPLGIPSIKLIEPILDSDNAKLATLFSNTSEFGMQKLVKELIQAAIPELEDIQVLAQKNQPVLYLFFKQVVHPIRLAGEGIVLLTKLACELATTAGGLVLLEEPETHLHPAGMAQAAKALFEATKRDIQIVLTTHNLDLIDCLLSEFQSSHIDDINVYRVQIENGELKSSRLTGSQASLARTQIEADVR